MPHRDAGVQTTAVVPSCLVSKLGAALVEFVCSEEFRKNDTRHSLDLRDLLLIDCAVRILLAPIVSLCR